MAFGLVLLSSGAGRCVGFFDLLVGFAEFICWVSEISLNLQGFSSRNNWSM